MAKGFDCATPLTTLTVSTFVAQGYTFVGRYLAKPGSWKRLSPAEVRIVCDAGLYIVSFFELYANRAREGAAAGVSDGQLALSLAQEVGQSEGSTIYFAVDYDAGPEDYNAIEAYMRAVDAHITGYELGIYGSYRVVEAMRLRGVSTKFMQTYAWSRGQRSEYASIYQYRNDIVQNGIGVDLDESNGDAGGWKTGMAVQSLDELKAQIDTLTRTAEAHIEKINALQATAKMAEIPAWARDSVDAAVKAGLIDTPNEGSYDFYRLLTVLHRKGIV